MMTGLSRAWFTVGGLDAVCEKEVEFERGSGTFGRIFRHEKSLPTPELRIALSE
jgi:hypothetical protein